ncbi:MAG: thioredoxin domain-containing protein [Halothiobacillaceae bacterium]
MPNRLALSQSPYLRQHADNPVDWYPWGTEALDLARATGRPILLSIGYAACHWCHVMAHESFEDPDTAEVMNRHFVNIKVDREQRPDLDKIYQTAHAIIAQRPGGWPLTIFLNPEDHTPFFSGTYFPPTPRYGMPGFADLLRRIAGFYASRGEEALRQGALVQEALARIGEGAPVALDAGWIDRALAQAGQDADAEHGGFGGAPKFPHPSLLSLIHVRCLQEPAGFDRGLGAHLESSLGRMARSGLYDQIGGGFYRYCVDAAWEIPHFEKMLYDNAQLLPLYADMARRTGNRLYHRVVHETVGWLTREMTRPDGGFASSLDADSEGGEGMFYLWTPSEVRTLVEPEDWPLLAATYGLDGAANFEGRWHLVVRRSPSELAAQTGVAQAELHRRLNAARVRLLERRARRVPPGRDDKLLTAWNALAIQGLVEAARQLDEPSWVAVADRSLAAIRSTLWQDGRLHATGHGAEALPGYLDDHAFLAMAIWSRLQQGFDPELLNWAIELIEQMRRYFEDRDGGGFWFTGSDHEPLIARMKPFADDALPNGNAIAARVLMRFGWLLGRADWLESAERTLAAAAASVAAQPLAHSGMLQALQDWLVMPTLVILRLTEAQRSAWQPALDHLRRQDVIHFVISPDQTHLLVEALRSKGGQAGGVAYICRGMQCLPPEVSPEGLVRAFS